MNNNAPFIVIDAQQWIHALRARGCSNATIATYVAVLRHLDRFLAGHEPSVCGMASVTPAALEAWQKTLDALSQNSANLFVRTIRTCFQWLAANGFLFASPAATLPIPPAPRSAVHAPAEDDVRRLIDGLKGSRPVELRDRALLEVAYSTGARLSELAALNLASVDFDVGTVRLIGKGAKERLVPLGATAARAVRKYLLNGRPKLTPVDVDALWISSRGGGRLHTAAIHQMVVAKARKAGLGFRTHDLRRGFATHLLRGAASPAAVKEMLGHSGYKHLYKYIQAAARDVKETHRNSRPGS